MKILHLMGSKVHLNNGAPSEIEDIFLFIYFEVKAGGVMGLTPRFHRL